jgi:hypothetical protein
MMLLIKHASSSFAHRSQVCRTADGQAAHGNNHGLSQLEAGYAHGYEAAAKPACTEHVCCLQTTNAVSRPHALAGSSLADRFSKVVIGLPCAAAGAG